MEKRVYVINCDFVECDDFNYSNKEAFKDEAERQGSVYSLDYFQVAFNENEINVENSLILID